MKTIISPSLLSCDFLDIRKEMDAFNGMSNLWFHLDIMDSHFVPNLTFGHPVVKKMAEIAQYPLDAHFMVNNPEFFIATFTDLNIHNVTFHFEATQNDNTEAIRMIKKAASSYSSVGISIRPSTSLNLISEELLKEIDLFLVMSVEPGFGGQKFIESAYDRVSELNHLRKRLKARFQIQVDGGINEKTAIELLKLGANNLVAGSYIFKASPHDYPAMVESLRKA